jgi:UDP-N-acetylmuramate--alanine ligase
VSSHYPIKTFSPDAPTGGGGYRSNTVLMNSPFGGSDKIRVVYFIGIGGIGMSAIAKFFHTQGVKVSGYDKTATPLTKEMETSGIAIHYEDNVDLVPKDAELVVYTPAVPKDHKEWAYYRDNGYKVIKRSDVLQLITEHSFNICIAGTHGKTTTTTMTAHVLRDSGFGCNAFLGGISGNYGTNFWASPKNVCVVEADEYDRSFLKLNPDIAVVTAMDPDHLDIYGTAEAVEQAFIDFSTKVKKDGLLIRKYGMERGKELKGDEQLSYHLKNEKADAYAANIRMMNGSYEFDVVIKDKRIENVRLNMGGLHNVENAIAAITIASSLDIETEKIKAAVASFRGVKRRFEYIIKNEKLVFIDDYAHHPEELRALITGARSLFEGWKCTIIFQPHLYTRTRDFADEFAEVLGLSDKVFLLPIYPARELPIEGVTSEMIADKVKDKKAEVVSKDELVKMLHEKGLYKNHPRLVITAGAGDIDTLINPVKESLERIK